MPQVQISKPGRRIFHLPRLERGKSFVMTVTRAPTNERARKTVVRLLGMGAEQKKLLAREQTLRRQRIKAVPRGGRLWKNHPHKRRVINAHIGATAVLQATHSVLADLRSISKFIEVAPVTIAEPVTKPRRAIINSLPERAMRLKIRFPDAAAMQASLAIEAPGKVRAKSTRRAFYSLELPASAETAKMTAAVSAGEMPPLPPRLKRLVDRYGAEVVPDIQYALDSRPFAAFEAPQQGDAGLDDVIREIAADRAWQFNQGEGAEIAIVDTGINGSRPEFGTNRRRAQWASPGEDAWTDWEGHGTMVACIAAGNSAEFRGVAPQAGLISCRTDFHATELVEIYEFLGDRAKEKQTPIIANNSWGIRQGDPPPPHLEDNDLREAMAEAIDAGVLIVFSAGNNHMFTPAHERTPHAPNSVWLYKSRDHLMAVGTTRLGSPDLWDYSSRGPGQFHGQPGTNCKPDVVAPTPANGRILYGDAVQTLPTGWGTSGASPQVAGLCALMKTKSPGASRDVVFEAIRKSAVPLSCNHPSCYGSGRIDCDRAVAMI